MSFDEFRPDFDGQNDPKYQAAHQIISDKAVKYNNFLHSIEMGGRDINSKTSELLKQYNIEEDEVESAYFKRFDESLNNFITELQLSQEEVKRYKEIKSKQPGMVTELDLEFLEDYFEKVGAIYNKMRTVGKFTEEELKQ
ncbi:MAG: hypothetical protein NTW50_00275 [Candidatus Berkelbacteria bacterium]|nr:hypothetical protein [Candidatus Berkelbacteria bacterium]